MRLAHQWTLRFQINVPYLIIDMLSDRLSYDRLRATEDEMHMADLPPYPGTPRWVKVFGIIALVMVLLFVFLMFTRGPGGHGYGRHLPSRDAGGTHRP